jgi:hypothetical protein
LPTQKVLKIFPTALFFNSILRLPALAHLGFAPQHKPTQKQTPKEPILPSFKKNSLNILLQKKKLLGLFVKWLYTVASGIQEKC